ncbi:diphthamide biosynthesis protein 2 [Dichotomocladium elegans]|nr:diphthamide biosynthesis protein 2 [Dichotomocladium elegans]
MATANGPTTFADDGRAVLERTVDIESVKHTNLDTLYEIDRTVDRILKGGYKRITLQFPDELLADAAAVASELEKRTGKKIYVLADTSYGSCCVDEVAAQHVNADFIVHYGRSCLSPTSHLPVLYVFGQQSMDIDHCVQEFQKIFTDPTAHVIIMCDVEYSYAVGKRGVKDTYTHIIPTVIQTESALQSATQSNETGQQEDNGRKRGGRYFKLDETTAIESCTIFFIGGESLTLTNIMMTYNKCPIFTYDPRTRIARRETVQVNRMLMKRYSLVQKAKDSQTIGIVVGTLGKVIRAAGRKSYTFVMGKLNVAKMANFMEVDCYVLVACPENSLIDSKEFYRPIVTPFELELALIRSKEWTGDYITDFSKLLPNVRTDGFSYDDDEDSGALSSDEEPHFSLVTGQYISTAKAQQEWASKLTDLSIRDNSTTISRLLHSTGGEYLKGRTFKGLEQNLGQTEVGTIEEGRSGIARGYQDEKDL